MEAGEENFCQSYRTGIKKERQGKLFVYLEEKRRIMGKKVYAVRKGRRTGLFDTWAECQKQINGYSGAEFKGFSNVEEARRFLEGSVNEKTIHTGRNARNAGLLQSSILPPDCVSEDGMLESVNEKTIHTGKNMCDADTAVAYVDGSFDKVSGNFSYGMVILYQGEELKFCQKIQDKDLAQMHNVAGEIKGAEAAMRYALEHGYKKIIIYHDYEGIAKWCSGAWKAGKAGTKAYKAYYDSVRGKLEIEFVKVKGHSGDRYNDMADALAKEALGIGKQG